LSIEKIKKFLEVKKMSDIQALKNGEEQYTIFTRKVAGKTKKYYQYDYRSENDELFSCIKPTLKICRELKDEWLNKNAN
jgi:hypothetical protein